MNITVLDEPDLEFGYGGRHIDPRHGIDLYGPADIDDQAVRTVKVGFVGSKAAIDGVKRWLDTCRTPIDGKKSRLGHLFYPFPGFDDDRLFRSTLVFNSRLERTISSRDLDSLATANPLDAVALAVNLYAQELAALHEEPNCNVVIVCRPDNLVDTGNRARPARSAARAEPGSRPPLVPGQGDFHSLLKARSLRYSQPVQIIRRSTWDPTYKEAGLTESRPGQDLATKAWNLHTALYYKNGGVPWRLQRSSNDFNTCYVGVAFYGRGARDALETSVAQVFNERGDGVIVRGGQAKISKSDRQPHLTEADSHQLLTGALTKYRQEHRQSPARIVLHKTSSFTGAETEGFRTAASEQHIDLLELIWLTGSEDFRVFRRGQQPPLRGTFVSLTATRHVLYTRGSIPFYRTYPGMYIPRPVGLRLHEHESSPHELAMELLSLTKLNWNATQLDGRDPITIRTADKVGEILRHLNPDEEPNSRYAFYM